MRNPLPIPILGSVGILKEYTMTERKIRHSHELEAAGETRWTARFGTDGLLRVTDEAAGQVHVATAYTLEGDSVRFALPNENGLRRLDPGQPGHAEFYKVVEKATGGASEADAAPVAASASGTAPKAK